MRIVIFFAILAILFTSPVMALPNNWIVIDGTNARRILDPSSNSGCVYEIGVYFMNTVANYTAANFVGWYDGSVAYGNNQSLDNANRITFASSEITNHTFELHFKTDRWDFPSSLGVASITRSGPYLLEAKIYINLTGTSGGRYFDLSSLAGRAELSALIGHEMAHCVGLSHSSSGVMQSPMDFSDANNLDFSSGNLADVGSVYTAAVKAACLNGEAPAFISRADIVENYQDGNYEVIIETSREIDVDVLVFKKADGGSYYYPAYDQFYEVSRVPLNSPNGGTYSYLDYFREGSDWYLVESIDSSGNVRDVLFLNSVGVTFFDYPPDIVDEMRSYNYSSIRYPKWKRIFSGEETIPTISDAGAMSCDYLIIAHPDFVQEIAPICDFWESTGLDVGLVGCDGEVHSVDLIKDFIQVTHSNNELLAVWLIGTANPTLIQDNIDLIPSVYGEHGGDFYYGDINNDGYMDIPVGRLPSSAKREVVFYVNKVLRYHNETTWGGKKDPAFYSTCQIISVPDNTASGSTSEWDYGQERIADLGNDLHQILDTQLGSARVEFLSVTNLPEWDSNDNSAFRNRIKEEIFENLEEGRHVVFGVSRHNSGHNQYGAIIANSWIRGVEIPGSPGLRPCETFWFSPQCFSNSLFDNVRRGSGDPVILRSSFITGYELFKNRGLLVFGSSQVTEVAATAIITKKFAERVFETNQLTGHPNSIGVIWKDIFNEVLEEFPGSFNHLQGFSIFGDPMLYIRDVYDPSSSIEDLNILPFGFNQSPNPFNGKMNFRVSGLVAGGGSVRIYDIRGRLVATQKLPKEAGSAILSWEGKDGRGQNVASGTYFFIITNQGRKIKGKAVYVK